MERDGPETSRPSQPLDDDRTRRRFLAYFSTAGLGSTLLPGVLWARVQEAKPDKGDRVEVDLQTLAAAERVAGLEFTDAERRLMLRDINDRLRSYERIRAVPLENADAPALRFDPRPPGFRIATPSTQRKAELADGPVPDVPADLEALAHWPVTQLARLVRARRVRSIDLTRMYLARLKSHDPALKCVVSLMEKRALKQASDADQEIAAGNYRGPLHGIPWGAKDLLATRDAPTTWGAKPFEDQVIDEDATVVQRLDAAGAVLVAKLTLGALAWGDVWFGGRTRNPWNPERGSSGSSAGPASATAAGLVGFSIGSETYGSIVSPSTACGVTGLRPTFGRVSRHGAMALSWTMDKLGPMCRSAEDCALVFDAIRGSDDRDPTVIDAPFDWDADSDVAKLRVGYLRDDFAHSKSAHEGRSLDTLRKLGVELRPIALPSAPVRDLSFILQVEAAAAFDRLTRDGRDDELVRQVRHAWPNVFRHSRLVPAVEYLEANRIRMQLVQAMDALLEDIDVYVAPSFGGDNLLLTNLTGHPTVVVPNGFTAGGLPTSISFVGALFNEAAALRLAKAFQDATDFHRRHPKW